MMGARALRTRWENSPIMDTKIEIDKMIKIKLRKLLNVCPKGRLHIGSEFIGITNRSCALVVKGKMPVTEFGDMVFCPHSFKEYKLKVSESSIIKEDGIHLSEGGIFAFASKSKLDGFVDLLDFVENQDQFNKTTEVDFKSLMQQLKKMRVEESSKMSKKNWNKNVSSCCLVMGGISDTMRFELRFKTKERNEIIRELPFKFEGPQKRLQVQYLERYLSYMSEDKPHTMVTGRSEYTPVLFKGDNHQFVIMSMKLR